MGEKRRKTICKNVESVKQTMEKAMAHSVDGSMKTIGVDLSDYKVLNNKICEFGKVFIRSPFEISVTNVSIADNHFKIAWNVKNGEYLYKNCNNLTVTVLKTKDDEKIDDEAKENVIFSKCIHCDLSTKNSAKLSLDKSKLREDDVLIFRINILNKNAEKSYRIGSGMKFLGYVEWEQDADMSY